MLKVHIRKASSIYSLEMDRITEFLYSNSNLQGIDSKASIWYNTDNNCVGVFKIDFE
jgi:hypothetical protein